MCIIKKGFHAKIIKYVGWCLKCQKEHSSDIYISKTTRDKSCSASAALEVAFVSSTDSLVIRMKNRAKAEGFGINGGAFHKRVISWEVWLAVTAPAETRKKWRLLAPEREEPSSRGEGGDTSYVIKTTSSSPGHVIGASLFYILTKWPPLVSGGVAMGMTPTSHPPFTSATLALPWFMNCAP